MKILNDISEIKNSGIVLFFFVCLLVVWPFLLGIQTLTPRFLFFYFFSAWFFAIVLLFFFFSVEGPADKASGKERG